MHNLPVRALGNYFRGMRLNHTERKNHGTLRMRSDNRRPHAGRVFRKPCKRRNINACRHYRRRNRRIRYSKRRKNRRLLQKGRPRRKSEGKASKTQLQKRLQSGFNQAPRTNCGKRRRKIFRFETMVEGIALLTKKTSETDRSQKKLQKKLYSRQSKLFIYGFSN